MEHIRPQSHLKLLQAILEELIKQRDPDASFVDPEPEPPPAKIEPVIGQPLS